MTGQDGMARDGKGWYETTGLWLGSFIVYGEVRQYRLTFVHRDDDDDDDEVLSKNFFKFLYIRPCKHALCKLLAVGTTPCRKDFYY